MLGKGSWLVSASLFSSNICKIDAIGGAVAGLQTEQEYEVLPLEFPPMEDENKAKLLL